jgi:pentatricopeptide repeat protein
MIKGYCKIKQMEKALELCNSLESYQVEPDQILFEYFLEGCAKNQAIEMAFDIFEIMSTKKIAVSPVSYNSIIEACVYSNNLDKGWKVLEIMESQGVSPDRYSYCFLFKGIKGPHQKRHLTKALDLIFESEESSEAISQLSYQHYCNNVLLNACIN